MLANAASCTHPHAVVVAGPQLVLVVRAPVEPVLLCRAVKVAQVLLPETLGTEEVRAVAVTLEHAEGTKLPHGHLVAGTYTRQLCMEGLVTAPGICMRAARQPPCAHAAHCSHRPKRTSRCLSLLLGLSELRSLHRLRVLSFCSAGSGHVRARVCRQARRDAAAAAAAPLAQRCAPGSACCTSSSGAASRAGGTR